ncbi:hypothetical protein [Methylocella sp. CPCC 101449]|uniref:hypothetical protein n=1 Tax=Methylocella sp. CPCC 101449 TaxID=2987531 RepID=UPI00288DCEB4|nr:hypothetical protein [Methylocella sp. CPCC 101449]MDT2021935.1 hypothetical protein [Methylocella sp. CPCC 101449]
MENSKHAHAVSRMRNAEEALELLEEVSRKIEGRTSATITLDKVLVLRIRLCAPFRKRLMKSDDVEERRSKDVRRKTRYFFSLMSN